MSRGGVDFEGIGVRTVTWKAAGDVVSAVADAMSWENDGRSAVVGRSVTITGDSEAGFGNAGDPLLGRIDVYEFDGYMTVQDSGYAEFPGVSGNLPSPGDIVVVDGNGAVMPSAGAVGNSRAVSVNSEENTVMVLIG